MDFKGFSSVLGNLAARLDDNHAVLMQIGQILQAEARSMLGQYQSGAGGIPGWPQLSQWTQEERGLLGFPVNEPLLRNAELQKAIAFCADGMSAAVGVPHRMVGTANDPADPLRDIGQVALEMEFHGGIPGDFWRSFLALAAVRKSEQIKQLLSADLERRLSR